MEEQVSSAVGLTLDMAETLADASTKDGAVDSILYTVAQKLGLNESLRASVIGAASTEEARSFATSVMKAARGDAETLRTLSDKASAMAYATLRERLPTLSLPPVAGIADGVTCVCD